MTLEAHYQYRTGMIEALERDLLGPAAPTEVIPDAPITQYVTGVLYPVSASVVDPAQDVGEREDGVGEDQPDPPVALASVRYPSSMGMTFAFDAASAATITVTVSAARYEPVELDESQEAPPTDGDVVGTVGSRAVHSDLRPWRRAPLPDFTFDLDPSVPESGRSVDAAPGLELFCRVRSAVGSAVPITLALVNRNTSSSGMRDADSFFQPRITVSASDGSSGFVARPDLSEDTVDDELQSYRLLYRHAETFAVGHGCSARWETAADRPDRATRIETAYMPTYELLLAESNPTITSPALGMSHLANAPRDSVIAELNVFVDEYSQWIDGQQAVAEDLPSDLGEIGSSHLAGCGEAAIRMRAGVELLAGDDYAWAAFRLANEAMVDQRARTDWLKAGSPGDGPRLLPHHAWRPFQLAFMLLCLEGIARPGSDSRDLADLLWFPTGGGKTEAYLGLIAFTIFRRRLSSTNGAGVTAIMRYTLRLLTIQQFERASMLICACEEIRRKRTDLGTEPISIGLWVGGGATPNRRRDARNALDRLANGSIVEEGNPVQLHRCPWCGVALDHYNYYLSGSGDRLVVDCRNRACSFFGGLPVYLVDEDIYEEHPSLIVATVDKYAGLPWREQVGSLFNHGIDAPPPELIVQDELHLISGPLGTLAGLYETVVDLMCTEGGRGPKIIASTATIRRAKQQASSLFAREIRQFPPPALDARDSYFAVEAPRSIKGTRLYVGLMAPGTSHATLMVRTYASLLQTAMDNPADPDVIDPYWTLVGYFNSLRVLGGARMQVLDDVNDRMRFLANERGTNPRDVPEPIELTSREPSASIPDYLNRMQRAYPDAEDVILATNMISVGVDVDRLGLMAVMGQPPSTSEYIQATSRVGRSHPGLVVDMLNAARSRDRSHYESFVGYHSALYREVEATSVTPFSPRARDRALHAIVVALARLLIPEFRPNESAGRIHELEPRLSVVRDAILARVAKVEDGDPEAISAVGREVDEFVEAWKQRADDVADLAFSRYRDPDRSLLMDAGGDASDGDEPPIPTLWSLRDVDRTSNLYLVR